MGSPHIFRYYFSRRYNSIWRAGALVAGRPRVPRAPGGPSPGDHPRVSGVYHSEEECYESGFLIFANTNKPFSSVLGFNQVFVYEVATSVCLLTVMS